MELTELKGVGEKRAEILRDMGLCTLQDIIFHFPRKYISFDSVSTLNEIEDGKNCQLRCSLATLPMMQRSKTGKNFVTCRLICEDREFKAMWFNVNFVLQKNAKNSEYLLCGRPTIKGEDIVFINPTLINEGESKSVMPVYSLDERMTQGVFSVIVKEAFKHTKADSVILGEDYSNLNSTLYNLHFPKSMEATYAASSRMAVEELVQLMYALKLIYKNDKKTRAKGYEGGGTAVAHFIKSLPFELTLDQDEAISKIIQKLESGYLLNALLQGDVGSGKTVVAFAVCQYVIASGYQAAIMAPTEVLSFQHYKNAKKYFGEGVRIAYLTGSMQKNEADSVREDIAAGRADIIIGTHAVFQRSVEYKNLALVVTDEQHRFGTRQRECFAEKGQEVDVLVMTATPIPRTLSLVFYGDMDIVTIANKPKNRKGIKTSIVPQNKYSDMFKYIREQTKSGHQAYIVCPSIYESEDYSSVVGVFNELKKGVMKDVNIRMLHGKMSTDDKNDALSEFASGKCPVLVATTVIEVGVDVKNADIIVIYDSDRFGLSSLHQLRGRVGRSDRESFCFLLTNSKKKTAIDRLKVLVSSASGFDIADKDFEMRGAGDLLGDRQSGFIMPFFKRVKLDGRAVERASEIIKNGLVSEQSFMQNAYDTYKNLTKITM